MVTFFDFDEELAKEVETELKLEYPNNHWSDGYVPGIIKLCCHGGYYFVGHAGAFDRYLLKLGVYRHICQQCNEMFFTKNKDENFFGTSCELEYELVFH
jgi:hypothetical protein